MHGKLAIYSRKSRFTGRGESVENQVELCKRCARASYPEYGDEDYLVFEDEGYSGKSLCRPQFQKMLAMARCGELDAVICYRLDRVSRNVGDFAALIEELEEKNVCFISVSERFDTSTPMGRAMMSICSVFAQLERETIAERIRDNMLELAKSGRWLGGIAPTGYRSIELKGEGACAHCSYCLEVLPEEAELVGLIYSLFLCCGSITGVESELIKRGSRTKNGRIFSRFAIRTILKNPVYAQADDALREYLTERGVELCSAPSEFRGGSGMMVYNKTSQSAGRAHIVREYSEWIAAVGKHKGLIDSQSWISVQRLLERNSSRAYRRSSSGTALLSGLVRCARCGSVMRPKVTCRTDRDGKRVFYYICEQKERSHGELCSARNIPGRELDEAFLTYLCEGEEKTDRVLALIRSRVSVCHAEKPEQSSERLKAKYRRQIDTLLESLSLGMNGAAAEYAVRRINELHEEISRLDREQNSTCHTAPEALERLLSFDALLSDTQPLSLNRLLRKHVDKVVCMEGEGYVTVKKGVLGMFPYVEHCK